jgi:hypothetical protein
MQPRRKAGGETRETLFPAGGSSNPFSEVKRRSWEAGIEAAIKEWKFQLKPNITMKTFLKNRQQTLGRVPLLLFWLLGVPLPVILLIWFIRG